MLHHVVEKVAICLFLDGDFPGQAALTGTTAARCLSGYTGVFFGMSLCIMCVHKPGWKRSRKPAKSVNKK